MGRISLLRSKRAQITFTNVSYYYILLGKHNIKLVVMGEQDKETNHEENNW